MNPKAIESKWQKKWTEAKAYESEPGGDKEKYFVNCPYPYMNGYLHLGHAFTYLRADMVSRYQRMQTRMYFFLLLFTVQVLQLWLQLNVLKKVKKLKSKH